MYQRGYDYKKSGQERYNEKKAYARQCEDLQKKVANGDELTEDERKLICSLLRDEVYKNADTNA